MLRSPPSAPYRPPKTIAPVAPSISGMAIIMVVSRDEGRVRRPPIPRASGIRRAVRDIGNVERGQDLLGRTGVIVGRSADQREAAEGDKGVDRNGGRSS